MSGRNQAWYLWKMRIAVAGAVPYGNNMSCFHYMVEEDVMVVVFQWKTGEDECLWNEVWKFAKIKMTLLVWVDGVCFGYVITAFKWKAVRYTVWYHREGDSFGYDLLGFDDKV